MPTSARSSPYSAPAPVRPARPTRGCAVPAAPRSPPRPRPGCRHGGRGRGRRRARQPCDSARRGSPWQARAGAHRLGVCQMHGGMARLSGRRRPVAASARSWSTKKACGRAGALTDSLHGSGPQGTPLPGSQPWPARSGAARGVESMRVQCCLAPSLPTQRRPYGWRARLVPCTGVPGIAAGQGDSAASACRAGSAARRPPPGTPRRRC